MGALCEATVVEAYGVRLGVGSELPGALAAAAERLPGDWPLRPAADPSLDGEPLDALLTLRATEGGWVVRLDADEMGRAASAEGAVDLLVPEIQLYLAEHARTHVLVHAGVVGWRGEAVVVPGRSFTGKSTLVEALVRAGASYYSDEFAVLDRTGRVVPFARPLALRSPDGSDLGRVRAESLGGAIGGAPLEVGLVLVAPFRPGARWSPRRLAPSETVPELLRNSLAMRHRPEAGLAAFGAVGRRAAGWAGERGDTAEVVAWLDAWPVPGS